MWFGITNLFQNLHDNLYIEYLLKAFYELSNI